MSAATAAAEPPDEPPGVRARLPPLADFHGLTTLPKAEVSFDEPMANSSMFSLPSMTAPSPNRLAVTVDSYCGMKLPWIFEAAVERTPWVQNRSLMPSGAPSSGPASPEAMRASEAAAISSAFSGVSRTNAFSGRAPSTAATWALVISTAENALLLRPSRAALRVSLVRSDMAYSTTLGTTKKPSALLGALARTRAESPPSVTASSRSGRTAWTTLVSGSTPSVSTSASCSIQAMMPFSSWASGSSRASGSAMRASRATLRTVAASMAILASFVSNAGVSRPDPLKASRSLAFAVESGVMPILDITDLAAALPAYAPLVGLDPGEKTIGVAVSDVTRTVASPLETIQKVKFTEDAARLFKLMESRGALGIVIGLPMNMDGTEGARAQSNRALARNILRLKDLPIAFWDERLSTAAVTRVLIEEHDVNRKRRAEVVDKMAAAWILQGALERMRNLAG